MGISSSGMIQQKQPGLHCIGMNQPDCLGQAGTPGVLCHASLNKVKVSKDENLRPKKHHKDSYASLLPLSVESYLYFLQMSHVLPWVSPQQNNS